MRRCMSDDVEGDILSDAECPVTREGILHNEGPNTDLHLKYVTI